ncbi:hypothetical protein [Herbidospora sp. RD11066]
MNANELIDTYVADVAKRLPRGQRADVAAELRTILLDELGERTETADARRVVDAFGRPAEAAARYRPPLVVLDPADSRSFLLWSAIGLAVIWVLGALDVAANPTPNPAIADWWLGVAIPSLWWPGLLITMFALASYTRRRWPQTARWRPRQPEADEINRTGNVAALVFFVCGTVALVNPGHVFPWLTYHPEFLGLRATAVLALMISSLVLYAAVITAGRWTTVTRRIAIVLDLVFAVVLTWVVTTGRVFTEIRADELMWPVLAGLLLVFALDVTWKVRRERR